MGKTSKLVMASLALGVLAAPAIAQKAAGKQPDRSSSEVPPGILKALENGFEGRGHGHGNDVPRGNGKGWGHLLHDHEDDPVSP